MDGQQMGYEAQADWENVVIQNSEFSFYILWKTIEFDEFYFLQTSSPLDSDFPQLWIHGNISCFSKSTRRETCLWLTPHLQTKRFMEFRVQDPVRDFRFSVYLSFIEIVKYSLRVEIAPRNSGKIFLKKHGSATESWNEI